jgi:hypothetical protein
MGKGVKKNFNFTVLDVLIGAHLIEILLEVPNCLN